MGVWEKGSVLVEENIVDQFVKRIIKLIRRVLVEGGVHEVFFFDDGDNLLFFCLLYFVHNLLFGLMLFKQTRELIIVVALLLLLWLWTSDGYMLFIGDV